MNIKDHLSEETLQLYLSGELSGDIKSGAALHLSYCPICRDLKNDLALKFAAQQMWQDYDRSASEDKTHVEENTFRDFWLDRIGDERLLNQIASHCIVCRDCREKREFVRTKIQQERVSVRALLLLAAIARQLTRPRVIAGIVSAAVLLFVLIKFWPVRQMPQPHVANKDESHAPVPVPTQNLANNSPTPEPPAQHPHANKPQTPPHRSTPPHSDVNRELLAQAQKVDLGEAGDFRDPENNSVKTNFTINASRSAPTVLRIVLPAHSKRGAYDVSIRDQAFLAELVPAKGKSSDGVNLLASMDLRRLKADNYVLRITRRDSRTGHDEYVGDYNVRIAESK